MSNNENFEQWYDLYKLKQINPSDYWLQLKGMLEVRMDYSILAAEQAAQNQLITGNELKAEPKTQEEVKAAFDRIRAAIEQLRERK